MSLVDKIMLAYHRKFAMTAEQTAAVQLELEAFLQFSHSDSYQVVLASPEIPSEGVQ